MALARRTKNRSQEQPHSNLADRGADVNWTCENFRGPGVHWFLSQRTVQKMAWFLTPHLRPGMRLLDAGSGPATITVGLAEIVAPAEVVGIDLAPSQVANGEAVAHERSLSNLRFEVADVAALPFPNASFDAAFSSNALEYLTDPGSGLRELRRVLKLGGVIGICDADVSTLRLSPDSRFTREFVRLFRRWREVGASPYYAPHQRSLLRDAHFAPREAFTFAECIAGREATTNMAQGVIELLSGPMGATLIERSWADPAQVEELVQDARAWGKDPDALWAAIQFAAVGWAS
jgi:ubiquinone/menaquinone biosynthesis C-methylase UbiE